jgi:hypothetical protein
MRDIPAGVLLLYTNSSRPYTTRLHSTTIREFTPDPLLHPPRPKFEPEAPLRMIKKLPKSVDNLDK